MKSSFTTENVLFEHDDFIVVNKPVNISMHSASHDARQNQNILSLVCDNLNIECLYLVHRLDTPTSGCLLLAKNQKANSTLTELFRQRQIEKFYFALISAKPRKKQGSIIGDMINRRKGTRTLLRTQQNPAITQFKTFSIAANLRLAVCRPITGKTHQIRVALKSIGSPIVGDTRYGGLNADRLYLHSRYLRFNYQGESIECMAPLDQSDYFKRDDCANLISTLSKPEHLAWPKIPIKPKQQ